MKTARGHGADAMQYERASSDDEHNYKLIESIERNAHHYIEIFSRAVDKCLPPPTRDLKYVSQVGSTKQETYL
jgi:DNA replication licensing factor MCM7